MAEAEAEAEAEAVVGSFIEERRLEGAEKRKGKKRRGKNLD